MSGIGDRLGIVAKGFRVSLGKGKCPKIDCGDGGPEPLHPHVQERNRALVQQSRPRPGHSLPIGVSDVAGSSWQSWKPCPTEGHTPSLCTMSSPSTTRGCRPCLTERLDSTGHLLALNRGLPFASLHGPLGRSWPGALSCTPHLCTWPRLLYSGQKLGFVGQP